MDSPASDAEMEDVDDNYPQVLGDPPVDGDSDSDKEDSVPNLDEGYDPTPDANLISNSDLDLDSGVKDADDDDYQEYDDQDDYDEAAPVKGRPIEIVIPRPSRPSDYQRIPPSEVVERLLGLFQVAKDLYYNIEYQDGHIGLLAYDDLIQLENGSYALRQYQREHQDPRISLNQLSFSKHPAKRALPEDDYDESDSDHPKRQQKRPRSSTPVQPARRSARQASLQAYWGESSDNSRRKKLFSGYYGLSDDEDEDEDEEPTPLKKAFTRQSKLRFSSARVTRSMNPTRQQVHNNSEDELAQSSDSDQDGDYTEAIPFIRSDIGGAQSRNKKHRGRPSLARYVGDDSEIEFEPVRKSQRANRVTKSMRVPNVNDEYEQIHAAPAAQKIAAVKEKFEAYSEESEFPTVHSETCESCNDRGDHTQGTFIPCQGCSLSFHKHCIGARSMRDHRATKVAQDKFVLQCKFCIGLYQSKDYRAPDYSLCQVCKHPGVSCEAFSLKKTTKEEEAVRVQNGGEDPIAQIEPSLIDNENNVLFRCTGCKRTYHWEHLPPLNSDTLAGASIRDERLEEYSRAGWRCKDCQETQLKIHALVAWRPADQSTYTKSQLINDLNADQIEYLVKWDGQSHYHDTWMPGAWVFGVATAPMRNAFLKRENTEFPKMTTESAIEEEWLLADVILAVKYQRGSSASSKAQDLARISDVVAVYVKFQGLGYDEVVWDEPPPQDSGARWDAFVAAYEEHLNGRYFRSVSDQQIRERINKYRLLDFQKDCELKSQPPSLREGRSLMEYQMEGVNWLLYNFHQQQNVILADEMGLGKTIQIVSFISALVQDRPKVWPFLIVVPNSTCPNWRRELKSWVPGIRVVAYHGGKVSQDLAFTHELFPNGVRDGMKAHVVIMSYEAAVTLKSTFNSVKWAGLVVDEGQRLKNEDTILYKTLTGMNIPCRVLLTGTPLQNNKRELFNLLQFIDPRNDAEELDAKYAILTKENIPEIHSLIRPYFLRRTKLQVLKFLPPMAQVIVPVTMTLLQEKLCRSIMAKNPELVKAIVSKRKLTKGDRKTLGNIMMDLRQCLCHPFCFNSEVEDKFVSDQELQRNLIEASPKLKLLEIMLPKLKENGHRVLIFSQFLGCLDILEDFLTSLGLKYGRIDGKISALKKQKQIDAFNAPDSSLFAMLLSTRSGGVGINLATADTVIIYDPDWNPHQDIQAISRAHRIGQKEKVLCFQLTTKNTVEEEIMQTGRRKMALDHALIESLDSENQDDRDIESILTRGAESLFSDKDKVKITYTPASVDKLLDRSQAESTNANDQTAETQFSVARVWANDTGTLNDNTISADDNNAPAADSSVWENILRLREEEHQKEVATQKAEYGRGARRRATQPINYNSALVGVFAGIDSDSDEDEDEDTDELTDEQRPKADSDGDSDVDTEDELYIDNGVDDDLDDNDVDADDYNVDGRSVQALGGIKQEIPAAKIKAPKASPGLTTDAPEPPRAALPQTTLQSMTPTSWKLTNRSLQVGERAIQTRELLPPIPRPSLPQMNPNPHPSIVKSNHIVPISHHGQPPIAGVLPSTTNIAPPNLPPSNILKSSHTTVPRPRGRPRKYPSNNPPKPPSTEQPTKPSPNVSHDTSRNPSDNILASFTGEGGSCLICKTRHPPNTTCVDFSSEVSIRLAIDSLRTGGDHPKVLAFKNLLINYLRAMAG
ncbi:PHD/FYVE-zinc-finger like domain-containing protein [Hypoxylon trugodes]|uniref:PHD/FYVE-zinc-finger like domain-containing protein n=1 Tax=Hypoxylon trugodes TaxID=326681 RepID=UPI002191EE64|nr:PHD/FYVE-zinc-finger like domain-containing protein [Hypoxylon trugodes]KAI1389568.1 PHD/FYVE-zinc-finger like domain-containing protein [Hypoxylon trugodes]